MKKYFAVEWPEYQIFMDHPKYKEECIIGTTLLENNISYLMVPEDLYKEVYEHVSN